MDTALQQSAPSLEDERKPLGDSDYKQPGLDFLSEDESELSDDSRPGHRRQASPNLCNSAWTSVQVTGHPICPSVWRCDTHLPALVD